MTATAFERQLAQHGSPALAGIKPANIITFSAKDDEDGCGLRELTAIYNRRFQGQDLAFQLLCECPRSRILMVYRPSLLEFHVKHPEVKAVLKPMGYRPGPTEVMLKQLGRRIRESRLKGGFPHEIGLFLGYPVEDVVGFMENKGQNYLYSCYWKVYSDVERAKAWCRRWEKVRDGLLKVVDSGRSIYDMFYTETVA